MTTNLISSHGTLERTKRALEHDLKSMVGDAGKLLNEITDATVEEFSAGRSRIEARYDEARASLHDARLAVTGKARYAAEATQTYVIENPWKTLGVLTAAGLIIAVINSRR